MEEFLDNSNLKRVEYLIGKGVSIPNPHGVEIGRDVDLDRISGKNTVLHTGCKILGRTTLILAGAKLGLEGPVTVDNCQIGPDVKLNGGYFKSSVFLEGASMGLGGHTREGTILEEQASGAHTVGLKQTILFPFVTLGSLINFCDCLMAGGTSRTNHSEVGSSYIHFNYTPNQDKATPSMLGDVPRGVMLNQKPIFLGGQGGLVGPCRLTYGTVIAAGTICRKDELRPDRLIFGGDGKRRNVARMPLADRPDKRIIVNNIEYIVNLLALQKWYGNVRSQFVSDRFTESLLRGLRENLASAIAERIRRLKAFILKFDSTVWQTNSAESCGSSTEKSRKQSEIIENWPKIQETIQRYGEFEGDSALRDAFLKAVHTRIGTDGKDYIKVIGGLNARDAEIGTKWLQGIVDPIRFEIMAHLPSFNSCLGLTEVPRS